MDGDVRLLSAKQCNQQRRQDVMQCGEQSNQLRISLFRMSTSGDLPSVISLKLLASYLDDHGVFFTSLYELTINKSSGYKEQLSFKRLNKIKLCIKIIYSDDII